MLAAKYNQVTYKFKETLLKIQKLAGNDFSGVGIIVYSEVDKIPLFPLRKDNFIVSHDDIVLSFLEMANYNNQHHDGFHLLSSNFKITHTSQYFSPPIIPETKVDYTQKLGGRYMAALFGSSVEGVLMTGVVTRSSGVIIFENGKKIYSKKWNKQ